MGGIADVVEQNLLPWTGAGVGDHQSAVVRERQRGRLEQAGERDGLVIALDSERVEVMFVVVGSDVLHREGPRPPCPVLDFQTVGVGIHIADDVTVLVHAEPLAALVPVTPGHA